MISRLSGMVLDKTPTSIVVKTGGVGFEVMISGRTFQETPPTGKEVDLHIYTHVREDEIRLVGFNNKQEKEFFIMLLDVSGISVKIALSALTIYGADELKRIISSKEADLIRRIPGIGRKLAERMILELRDKVERTRGGIASIAEKDQDGKLKEVKEALKTLGYNNYEINKSLDKLKIDEIKDKKIEEILKAALKEV